MRRSPLHVQRLYDEPMSPIWPRVIGWIGTRPLRVLLFIFLLDLGLDVASLWRSRAAIVPAGKANEYWQIALNVAHGRGYVACLPFYFPFCGLTNQQTAMREPGGVLPFAVLAKLTGGSLYATTLLELAIDLAILPGVFLLARNLAGKRVALLAALLWAIYLPPITDFVPTVSGDLLATLGVTWGLCLLLGERSTHRWRDWVAIGVCLGVAGLARQATLVIVPVVALGLLVRARAGERSAGRLLRSNWRPIAIVVLLPSLMLLPWVARNTLVFGQPVIGSTLTGYNLYRMNYMLADENFLPLHFVGDAEARRAFAVLWAQRPDVRGPLNEAQTDAVYRQTAVRLIEAHPLRYMLLSASRFLMLWFDWTVNAAYGGSPGYFTVAQQGLLLLAAIIGLCAAWRRTWLLGLSIIAVTILYMAVVGRVLYLVPVMPLTIVLCAIGCQRIGQHLVALDKCRDQTPPRMVTDGDIGIAESRE